MKCGQNYDYCGPLNVESPTFFADAGIIVGGGNNLAIPCPTGNPISIGTRAPFYQLPWPACASSTCIAKKCTGGQQQGISNYETSTCVYNANGPSNFYLNIKYDAVNTDTDVANQQSCSARTASPTTIPLC